MKKKKMTGLGGFRNHLLTLLRNFTVFLEHRFIHFHLRGNRDIRFSQGNHWNHFEILLNLDSFPLAIFRKITSKKN